MEEQASTTEPELTVTITIQTSYVAVIPNGKGFDRKEHITFANRMTQTQVDALTSYLMPVSDV